jgi:beta-RFAP synthase
MFSFGRADRAQFGGVGVMVDPPALEVTITPAERFAARGALSARTRHFAGLVARNWQLPTLPWCEIDVLAPPDHVGLGIGTQLGLSIAAGLRQFLHLPDLSTHDLALSVDRGARSAVGTYGFQIGGLIVDAGKEAGALIGRLARRAEVPAAWRFVLVRRGDNRGLAGDREGEAFARLPPVPDDVTRELWRITEVEMLPAIGSSDCGAFGDAVYRFGRLAGECFAAVHGGPFADHETARLVDAIREHGVSGVGQSSWGPTVFAITADDAQARSLATWLRQNSRIADLEISIAEPNNRGAVIETK